MSIGEYEATSGFLSWLEARIITAGRGDNEFASNNDPLGRFWLGRLAPEEKVLEANKGERGERLEPCAMGFRLQPTGAGPWTFDVRV